MNNYSGLTILLGRPSRFDYNRLISSSAGEWFDKIIGKHGLTRENLIIQSIPQWEALNKPIHPDTKCILSLGWESHYKLRDQNTTLDEQRGSPYKYQGINCISSFAPQDAFDFKNYEDNYHTSSGDYDSAEEDKNDKNFNKSHGVTSRRNYRFWLRKDIHKAIRATGQGLLDYSPEYIIYPSIEEIEEILFKYQNQYLHIDIEVDVDTLDITCFAFTFEDYHTHELLTPIYIVPLRRYNYECAYDRPFIIWRAIAIAFSRNTVVTYNGHQFDLFVFTYKYRIPFPKRNYDAMIGHHRCFPEVEKSLGHSISLFTDLPYHKNDGIYSPNNRAQELELWKYCGKDVYGMYECRKGQETYAKSIGAWDSIIEANESIVVYLTETVTGIRRDEEECKNIVAENETRIRALVKILNCLVGEQYNPKFLSDGELLNPRSPKQMVTYLFNKKDAGGLGLEPIAYGKIGKSGKANPKADEKVLLKLQVKHNLPSLSVILELRRLKKQNSDLDINFWNPHGRCSVKLSTQEENDTTNENEDDTIINTEQHTDISTCSNEKGS
jgi:hypothetical protein